MGIPGGINPRRVDQYTAAGTPPPSPAPQGGTIRAQSVIITGTLGELLAYAGPPANGNLIASIAAAQFTDPKGNLVLNGITNYFNNTPNNPAFIALQMFDGVLSVLSAPGPGGPYTSVGQVQLGGSGSFSVAGLTLMTVGGGADSLVFGNGYAQAAFGHIGGALILSKTDVTPVTVTTSTVLNRITPAYSIPASNANVGTIYKLKWSGNGTAGAAQTGFGMAAFLNGNTGVNLWDVSFPNTLIGANHNFSYTGEIEVTATAIGATANFDINGWLMVTDTTTGVAQTAIAVLEDTGNAWNSTNPNTLEMDFQWGAVSAGRTVTNLRSTFERVGV